VSGQSEAAPIQEPQFEGGTPPKQQSGLHKKLITAAKSVNGVEKKGQNAQQGYAYARAEDVIAVASQALTGVDLSVVPTMGEVETIREYETRGGSYGVTVRVEMLYTVVDPDTGEELLRRYLGTGSDAPGDKAIYKAVTGAAKYFYAGLLGIGFGADPENETGGEGAEPVRAASAAPVVRLSTERTERIIAAVAGLRLPYKEIAGLLATCQIDALRANTADAIRERVVGLGEVEADKLEAELARRAQDADATAPDEAPALNDRVDDLLKGIEIVKPLLGERGVNQLDGLNVELGALGIDGIPPRVELRSELAKLTTEQADALDARLSALAEELPADAEVVDAEVVEGGGEDGE
jgi:hypothetical protein